MHESTASETGSSARFVPATGLSFLLPFYDTAVALLTREQHFKKHLLDRANLAQQANMLDVGCGTGTLLLDAASRSPQVQVVGIDTDPAVLKIAKRKSRHLNSLRISMGNATDLPEADDQYDLVTTTLVLHHLLPEEKCQALQEMHRVLKPGGRLLLADFGQAASWLAYAAFTIVRIFDGWTRTKCNILGRLPDLISSAGFTDVTETLAINTPLGTIRCYEGMKSIAR